MVGTWKKKRFLWLQAVHFEVINSIIQRKFDLRILVSRKWWCSPFCKYVFHSSFPEVYVTIPNSIPKLKTLCTNHPCALCDFHGHYTRLYPCLEESHSSLEAFRQFEAKRDKIPSHLFASSASVEPEDMPAPIKIPPPDVEMEESSAKIFYLSSSMRPSVAVPLGDFPWWFTWRPFRDHPGLNIGKPCICLLFCHPPWHCACEPFSTWWWVR